MKRLLSAMAVCALFASSAAVADVGGGTPNTAAGARGHNAPSAAEATPGVIAGHPHATINWALELDSGEGYHGPHHNNPIW